MATNRHVVVIAASVEGIDALARLIKLLPLTFPAPLVAHVPGLTNKDASRMIRKTLVLPDSLKVVFSGEGEPALPGCLYLAPAGNDLVFTAANVLGLMPGEHNSRADLLFHSAARFHGSCVIGVVLSGNGVNGTRALQSATEGRGTQVVQSPGETTYPSMPSNALVSNTVQYSVMLDQMGPLLSSLVQEARPESIWVQGTYTA